MSAPANDARIWPAIRLRPKPSMPYKIGCNDGHASALHEASGGSYPQPRTGTSLNQGCGTEKEMTPMLLVAWCIVTLVHDSRTIMLSHGERQMRALLWASSRGSIASGGGAKSTESHLAHATIHAYPNALSSRAYGFGGVWFYWRATKPPTF